MPFFAGRAALTIVQLYRKAKASLASSSAAVRPSGRRGESYAPQRFSPYVQPSKTDPPKMRVIRLPPARSVWRSAGQIPLGGGCPVRCAGGVRRSSASRYQHFGYMDRLYVSIRHGSGC